MRFITKFTAFYTIYNEKGFYVRDSDDFHELPDEVLDEVINKISNNYFYFDSIFETEVDEVSINLNYISYKLDDDKLRLKLTWETNQNYDEVKDRLEEHIFSMYDLWGEGELEFGNGKYLFGLEFESMEEYH